MSAGRVARRELQPTVAQLQLRRQSASAAGQALAADDVAAASASAVGRSNLRLHVCRVAVCSSACLCCCRGKVESAATCRSLSVWMHASAARLSSLGLGRRRLSLSLCCPCCSPLCFSLVRCSSGGGVVTIDRIQSAAVSAPNPFPSASHRSDSAERSGKASIRRQLVGIKSDGTLE